MSSTEDDFDFDSDDSSTSTTKSPLDRLFDHATQSVRMRTGEMDKPDLLYLYGRFKYALEGPCTAPKPGMFNFEAKAKWESWKSQGNGEKSRDQCKQEYIDRLDKILVNWRQGFNADAAKPAPSGNQGTFGVRISVMAGAPDGDSDNSPKTCFDLCKEGNLDKLKSSITNVDEVDENGMTMLMWACDRGQLEIVRYLVERGADLNKQDSDGQTCLHYAVSCEHLDIVRFLIGLKGIDRNLEDSDGQKPIDMTQNNEIIQVLS